MPASWYRDGTVSVVQGSKTVVGAGTLLSVQAKTGDLFFVLSNGGGEKIYEIESIIDNTHLTLVFPYAEDSNSAAQYAVVRNFNNTMTAETNAQLVSFLREWKLALQNNLKGDTGDTGADGRTLYSNNGAPASGLGVDDDWCMDYASWNMYRKEAGAWVLRGNIKGGDGAPGAPGARWYSYESDPPSAIGVTGDYAMNLTTGDVFKRLAGGWALDGNMKGRDGDEGPQGPQGVGIQGIPGTPGSRWYTVTGMPSTALGVNTDIAVDEVTNNLYQKDVSGWVLKGNLQGRQGIQGVQGAPGATWKGEWSSSTEYVARDAVYYNGNSYVALQTGTNQTPPATSNEYWQIVARKGTDGAGAGDMLKIDYDDDGDGKVNAADTADTADYATAAGRATVADNADAVAWENVTSRPSDYTPSAHALDAHTGVSLAELNTKISDATIPSDATATTSAAGLVELATDAEFDTGTDTARYASVAQVRQMRTGFKNLLINGNFDIWQRGTAFGPDTWGVYSADRWLNVGSANYSVSRQEFTAGQTDVPNNPRYFLRIVPSESTTVGLIQRIEDVLTCAGQTITLSFWAKASADITAGTNRFRQNFGSGGSSEVSDIGSTSVSLTTAWQKFIITATLPSVSGKTIGSNSCLVVELCRTTTDKTIDIAQVQIELGGCATPFEQRPIGLELELCQRYFERLSGPALSTIAPGQCTDSNRAIISLHYSTKRTSPSITLLGDFAVWNAATAGRDIISYTIGGYALTSSWVWGTIAETDLVAGNATTLFRKDGDGYIDISAELQEVTVCIG